MARLLPGEEPPSCPSLMLDLPVDLDLAKELSPDLLAEPDTPPSLILTDEVRDPKTNSQLR